MIIITLEASYYCWLLDMTEISLSDILLGMECRIYHALYNSILFQFQMTDKL